MKTHLAFISEVTTTAFKAGFEKSVLKNLYNKAITRTLLIALICLLGGAQVVGQTIDTYTFTAVSGTYTATSGQTQLLGASSDDALSATTNIGFTFNYEGTAYTQFKASTNGWITFNTGITANYNANSLASPGGRPIIAPLWDDLENDNAGSQKYLNYRLTGTAPNRVLTIEWHRQRWRYSSSNDVISIQCKLYETTDIIEFAYSQGVSGVVSASASIGLTGITSGFASLNNTSSSPTVSYSTETSNLNTKPATGQIYRWTPPGPSPWQLQWISSVVPNSWCPGQTQQVSVTVKNVGTSTWTNTGPDINIGSKWNFDADYFVREHANNLAPGATQTYTFNMTAPTTPGAYSIGFDVVNEGNCWFSGNAGVCGPGNPSPNSTAVTVSPTGENCSCPQDLGLLSSPYSSTTVGYSEDMATCRTSSPDRIFYLDVPDCNELDIWESVNSFDEYEYLGYGATCPGTQIQCWDNDALNHIYWTNNTGSTQRVWFILDGHSNDQGTFTLNWSLTPLVPAQPSAITGLTNPEVGASQVYSVTNVGGVTYTWAFPAGWSITAGQGTNSVTVTVGASNGTISVTPSNTCGSGTARTLATNIPDYRAKFISMNYGASPWCSGTSRTVTVDVQNTGLITWNGTSVRVGVKWNGWTDYHARLPTSSHVGGQTKTYTFTAFQASNATSGPVYGTNLAVGNNNLTFDVVHEAFCWFGNNDGDCGPGNSVYTSPAISITGVPSQPSAIAGATSPCQGTSQNYSVTNVTGVTYAWTFPAGWTQTGGGTTNSITVTVGSGSGNITVTPSNACGNGAAMILGASGVTTPANPAAVSTANVSCEQLTLNWNHAANAAGYEIQVSTASNFSTSITGNNCGGVACGGSADVGYVNTALITGLAPNTQYWIRVRARSGSAPCRSGWTNLNTTSVTTVSVPVAPVLTLSASNICIGDVVSATLQTAGSGGLGCSDYYQYSVDDGTNWLTYTLGTAITALVTYPNVRFRAVWANCSSGCSPAGNNYSCSINSPAPTLSLSGVDASQCNDGSVTLTVTGGNAPFTYDWSGSNGYISSGSPSINSLSGATYTVTVTDGVCGYVVTGSKFINAPWVADAGPDITTCSFPVTVNWGFAGTIPSSVSSETAFSETFESYGDVSPLPATGTSWRQTSVTGSSWFWEIDDNCAASQGSRNLTMADGFGYECDYNWDDNGNKIAWYGTQINATAFTNLKLKFDWKAYGESGYDYGRVVWSLDGTNWTDVSATNYVLQSNWATVSNIDLSVADGQQFYLGFRWLNDGNTGTAPGFNIDDIRISGDFVNVASYSWTGPGGFTSNVQNPSVSLPGTYTLSTTLGTCTVTDQAIVYSPTIPAVPVVGNSGPVCSGSTVDLTASGMAPGGDETSTNDVLNLNGTNQSITTGLNDLSGDEITIEYWFKGTNVQSAVRQQSGGDYIVAGWSSPPIHILSNDQGTSNGLPVDGGNGAKVHDGQWHHVCMVWQRNIPNGFKAYFDGSLVAQRASNNTAIPNMSTATILGSYLGSGEFTNGKLDNVRIWSVARSQAQIRADMYLETPTNPANLLAHYKLNGDFSCSNNAAYNGTGNNAPAFAQADYYTYTWSGTGAPAGSINETQTTTALPSTPSSQNYTVIATAGGCSGTVSATNTVTINPTVSITSVTAAFNGSACSSSTVNITAVATGSLNWWTGAGGTGTNYGTANPLNGVPPGTYYARVSGTCGGPIEQSVTATPGADVTTPDFTAANPPLSICQNAANTSYAATASNTSGAITYSVSSVPAGAGTINSSTGEMDWNAAYTGTATITASAPGCNGPKLNTWVTTVNPNLAASVSITASANTICPNASVSFTATPVNEGSTPTYQWKIGSTNVGSNSSTFTPNWVGSEVLTNGDVVTVVMTSNATCATGSPYTSNGETITVIDIAPVTPVASITVQPTCSTPGGTIVVSSPTGAAYEYALNNGTYQSNPAFTGQSAGNYSVTARLIASPTCVSLSSTSMTISNTPSPLPSMTDVIICQGGSGSLSSANGNINCISNFLIPFNRNSIYFGWNASGDPTAATPTGTNTATCAFGGPVRTYSIVEFQVSFSGNYIFEMNDNPAYNGVGYIYTGSFTPGSCATGTLVRADSNSGTGNEPQLGGAGGAGAMYLTAGVTYYLVSSTEGGTDVTGADYTWTITPPTINDDIMLNVPGDVVWYTAASGGSPIFTGNEFNPVGYPGGIGPANTNAPGTTTYYAACSSSPDCRAPANFVVTSNFTLSNVTPSSSSTCYNPLSSVSVGLDNSVSGYNYQLVQDGTPVGPLVPGSTGSPIAIGNTTTAGIYTVIANIPGCSVPMLGSVEIKPAPVAEAGPTVTLCNPNPPSVMLSGTSNLTTTLFEDFGNPLDDELTNTTAGWRIHYLHGSHPANRTEWHIGNATGSSTAPPYSIACATAGAALTTVDRRQFQTDVPCDYAWDNGEMDEIAYSTEPIDAQLYTSVTVRFNYMAGGNYNASRNPQVTDYYQVVYSLDNGATWVPVNAGNNAGSYTLRNGLGATNAFFSIGAPVTGVANVSMPAAVTGGYFLLGFRWTNDGNRSGDNVNNMMIDNIEIIGDTDYDWFDPADISSGEDTPTPTVTAAGTYTLTVTAGNGCQSTDEVVVLPRAEITNMTASSCSGNLFTVAPVNGVNGTVPGIVPSVPASTVTTYSWPAPSVVGITGTAAGSNATNISGTLTNTTNAAIPVVYTVTPKANGCDSPTFTVTVTVNPTPNITTSPMAVTACSGSVFNVAPANVTNGVVPSGTTYSWPSPTVTGGLGNPQPGSGASAISGNLTNPTASPQTATYTVTPSISGSCPGSTFTVIVTVNPPVTIPAAISTLDVEPTCQLTASTTTNYESSATVGTLEWSLTNIITTNGTLSGTAINTSTGVMTWPAGWSGSVTIRVRSTGCGTSGYVTRNVTLGPPSINPGHRTWTGLALDQLWQTDGNWDCGGVPTSTDDVIIPEIPVAGVNETPRIENGIVGFCNTIEIQSTIANPSRIEIQNGGRLEVSQ